MQRPNGWPILQRSSESVAALVDEMNKLGEQHAPAVISSNQTSPPGKTASNRGDAAQLARPDSQSEPTIKTQRKGA